MNPQIKKAFEKGQLVLFIGAGCSLSSKDQYGNNLLSSGDLSEKIAKAAGWPYNKEPLGTVYSAARKQLGNSLDDILIESFKHCQPSLEYITLSKYIWPRIYTINIDDSLDYAFIKNSPQNINFRHRFDKVVDQDILFNKLDIIKLNGSIDKVDKGFIFSPNEYGEASAKPPHWYKELAEDYFRYTFLFVGTKLNEPLFYHQIERHKIETSSYERRSYVLTPNASLIEKGRLEVNNIEHISGSLSDFVEWLKETYDEPLSSLDIAYNKNPALKEALSKSTSIERKTYVSVFEDIFLVNRESIRTTTKNDSKIRPFYRGFKPDWRDIFDEVPAYLSDAEKLQKIIEEKIELNSNLIVAYGPAGCGKTTLLKQVSKKINETLDIPCFFLERPTSDFKKLVCELEKIYQSRFCLFFDRLDSHALDIKELFESKMIKNCLIIGSENQRKWKSELIDILDEYCDHSLKISVINRADAKAILKKIEIFGPWTRLSKMTQSQRMDELLNHSKRQLLIGLLETTYGLGFEKIIEKEYSEITDQKDRAFVNLIGLATINKHSVRQEYISRALTYLNINYSINYFMNRLSGIIHYDNGIITARHHVYVRHLFNEIIPEKEIFPILKAFIASYTVYESPIIKNVNRNEAQLFKALINHKFLKDIFRQNNLLIRNIYESFEKEFEKDGHFLLQFGLALRDFNYHLDAYEKIKTALVAFPNSSHIEHALAQQELILACDQNSREKAFDLLESALEKLETLNTYFKSRSAYPIVTMSEGHTCVMIKFENENSAKIVAKSYANRISSIRSFQQNSRLKATWKKLTNFVTLGLWEDEKNNHFTYSCDED